MKKILKIGYYMMLLGWMIFMFLAMYASSLSIEWRMFVMLGGFIVCVAGSLTIITILPGDEHLKSIEELREAKEDYKKATNKLLGEFYQKMRDL